VIQEIGGKTDLPDGDQTGHHIRSQCGESVSVCTEDYLFAGRNGDFEVSEESSGERNFLFRSWTHSNSRFLRCELGRVPF